MPLFFFIKSDQEYLSKMDGCSYCIPSINFLPSWDLSLGLLLSVPSAKTDEGCCKNSKDLFKLLTAEWALKASKKGVWFLVLTSPRPPLDGSFFQVCENIFSLIGLSSLQQIFLWILFCATSVFCWYVLGAIVFLFIPCSKCPLQLHSPFPPSLVHRTSRFQGAAVLLVWSVCKLPSAGLFVILLLSACILLLLCLCLYLFVFLFVYEGDDLAWFVPRWYVPLVHAANQLLSPMHLYSFPFKQHQLFLFEKCFLIVR